MHKSTPLKFSAKMPTPEKSSVQVIDILDFPCQSEQLMRACEEWGCFRIMNFDHILPHSLMLEMKVVSRSLLELPMEIKIRNMDTVPLAGSGYMAPFRVSPIHEALGLYDMASPNDVDAFCSNLKVTPYQREIIAKYTKAVNELMMDIAHKIGEGLGVKGASFKDWSCQFKINKYNFTSETVGLPGVKLHTDSSFLTILQDDEVNGGLEVMKRCGTFEAVDPCPRKLLVNLGDIATVWSNGRFVNVKHRVMCKEATTRLSIASFLLGPKEVMVEIPEELVGSDHPRLYVPFTYEEYRNVRVCEKLQTGAIHHFMQ